MSSRLACGRRPALTPAQWGDSTPLVLPNVRFRDLALFAVHVATQVSPNPSDAGCSCSSSGGTAFFVAPIANGVSDAAFSAVSDSIVMTILTNKAVEFAAEVRLASVHIAEGYDMRSMVSCRKPTMQSSVSSLGRGPTSPGLTSCHRKAVDSGHA